MKVEIQARFTKPNAQMGMLKDFFTYKDVYKRVKY